MEEEHKEGRYKKERNVWWRPSSDLGSPLAED
jgi:hypothetical protein